MKWKNILPLFLLFTFLGGCSSKENDSSKKVAQINLKDDPQTLDPRVARDPNAIMLTRMFFEGLTRIGPGDKPELALAKGVEISEDLKTYIFTLREAFWSDGSPVRAHDFVTSWRKTLSPDFASDQAYQLYILKNGRRVKAGEAKLEELGVLAVDDHTLLVELEYPIPYVLELLASPFFFPIPESAKESKWGTRVEGYVSNGPFLLKSWHHSDEIWAEKNPLYWDADTVQLDSVHFVMLDSETEMQLFEKGRLHWAGSPLSTLPLDALSHLKEMGNIHIRPRAETAFLRANVEKGPLKNRKFRHALALAIDRKSIVEHVTQGGQIPASSLLPPSLWLKQDPYFADGAAEEAVQMFEEALAEEGLTRESFPKLDLLYIHSERSHLIAQAIQEQWRKTLGIKIGLEAIERKVYFDKISKQDYALAFCSWGADFHDPINFLEVFKYKSQSTNNTHWENPQYVQLLNDSFRILNPEERLSTLAKCEEILIEEMPIIPIFHYTMSYLQDPNLEGVFLSPMGQLDFKWANLNNSDS